EWFPLVFPPDGKSRGVESNIYGSAGVTLTYDLPSSALIGRTLERRDSVAIAIADIDVSGVRVRLNEMSMCMRSGLVDYGPVPAIVRRPPNPCGVIGATGQPVVTRHIGVSTVVSD